MESNVTPIKKMQLDLFQNFIANTEQEKCALSNMIELWDTIPRYSMTHTMMEKLRDDRGFLGLHSFDFQYRNVTFNILIQPALVSVKNKDGETVTKSFYPSPTEGIIEDVLRKMAVTGGYADPTNNSYGVRFTLYQLRAELARCGHTRSFQQIKHSLDVLARSFIQIKGEGVSKSATKQSTYLASVTSVSKKELAIDPDSQWLVTFHPFVSQGIESLQFRQYNYDRVMQHSRPLAKWLDQYLIAKYTFASPTKNFVILYSTIKRDSRMLDAFSRERDAISECDLCIDELVKKGSLREVKRDVNMDTKRNPIPSKRGKILEVRYELLASESFCKETAASNKRAATHQVLSLKK